MATKIKYMFMVCYSEYV